MIDPKKLEKVKAIKINIEGFSDQIVWQEIEIVEYNNKKALFLGEFDMWYWIAPIETLVAEKVAETDFEMHGECLTATELENILLGLEAK